MGGKMINEINLYGEVKIDCHVAASANEALLKRKYCKIKKSGFKKYPKEITLMMKGFCFMA